MASQRYATEHAKEEVVYIPDNAGNPALHHAVRCGDTSSVRMLLEGNASVNQKNHNGQSVLHIFCEGSHSHKPDLELLNILITFRVDVNLQDKNGETPLHISLHSHKYDFAMAMIENGAWVTIPDSTGEWPLHKAVEYSKLSLVRKMLDGNASVHQTNLDGQSALHVCCKHFRSKVLITLITCKADVNLQDKNGDTPLHISLKCREILTAMVLLENGALSTIPNNAGEWPLHKAVEYSELSLVRKMLEGNASVHQTNLDGQSALHVCCKGRCSIDVLNTLITYKADVNLQDKNGNTPLLVSVKHYQFKTAMALLENGALTTIPNSAGEWPLHKAVEYGELSLVRKMLEGNASVHQTNLYGESALHVCCRNFRSEVLITLITCKADVNLQDMNGDTPLHISLKCREFLTAMVLLENGALTTIPNNAGEWPLHKAVEYGEQSLVRKMLEGNASANKANQTVNKIDRKGKSALHILCGKSNRSSYDMPILMELIKYKANVNLQDKEGWTPMHISCAAKKWDLTMALLETGALATIPDNTGKCPLHCLAFYNPKEMLHVVNLCTIKPNENTELIIEACELAAMYIACPASFECMHKATLLRIEHAIPKRTSEPMECYGFRKEWETIEELETYKGDDNQLKLQAILSKERIHRGQYEKLVELIQEDLVSVVLSARKSETGALLKHHLNIWSGCKYEGNRKVSFRDLWRGEKEVSIEDLLKVEKEVSFEDLLKAWKNELEGHFESFDTMSIVELTQMAIRSVCQISDILPSITSLIMKLYRRNRQVESTSKSERMLAKELLQQLLDTDKGGEQYPFQHLITEQSFKPVDDSYTSCDYELMKMLLESRIQVNAVDCYGDTILHAAVSCIYESTIKQEQHGCELSQEIVDQWIRTIQLLLDNDVYPNAQNDNYETARDKLDVVIYNGDESIAPMDVKGRIDQILQQYELQNSMTLQHMAAVAVTKSGYSYENVLPDALVKFVDLHKPRRDMISDSVLDHDFLDFDCD